MSKQNDIAQARQLLDLALLDYDIKKIIIALHLILNLLEEQK